MVGSWMLNSIYRLRCFSFYVSKSMKIIIINGKVINNIRFADDTVIIASSAEELQMLLSRTSTFCEQFGLQMHVKKTKYMIITKETDIQANINLLGRQIERV